MLDLSDNKDAVQATLGRAIKQLLHKGDVLSAENLRLLLVTRARASTEAEKAVYEEAVRLLQQK